MKERKVRANDDGQTVIEGVETDEENREKQQSIFKKMALEKTNDLLALDDIRISKLLILFLDSVSWIREETQALKKGEIVIGANIAVNLMKNVSKPKYKVQDKSQSVVYQTQFE